MTTLHVDHHQPAAAAAAAAVTAMAAAAAVAGSSSSSSNPSSKKSTQKNGAAVSAASTTTTAKGSAASWSDDRVHAAAAAAAAVAAVVSAPNPSAAPEDGDDNNNHHHHHQLQQLVSGSWSSDGAHSASAAAAATRAAASPSSAAADDMEDDSHHQLPQQSVAAGAGEECMQIEAPRTAMRASRFARLCVFCGAYSGSRRVFEDAAVQLGSELVRRGIGLVYGGGSVGLMGRVSRVVSDGGQQVLGVIPRALMQEEITGKTVGKVVEVGNMHQRKAEMARLADAFIALPGGYGTLEELLEVITWSQLGIHDKPVGLLNVDGYYDSLLAFLDNAVSEGFIQPSARHIFVSAQTSNELMSKLEEYVAHHDQVASKHCWESNDMSDGICRPTNSGAGSGDQPAIAMSGPTANAVL